MILPYFFNDILRLQKTATLTLICCSLIIRKQRRLRTLQRLNWMTPYSEDGRSVCDSLRMVLRWLSKTCLSLCPMSSWRRPSPCLVPSNVLSSSLMTVAGQLGRALWSLPTNHLPGKLWTGVEMELSFLLRKNLCYYLYAKFCSFCVSNRWLIWVWLFLPNLDSPGLLPSSQWSSLMRKRGFPRDSLTKTQYITSKLLYFFLLVCYQNIVFMKLLKIFIMDALIWKFWVLSHNLLIYEII